MEPLSRKHSMPFPFFNCSGGDSSKDPFKVIMILPLVSNDDPEKSVCMNLIISNIKDV